MARTTATQGNDVDRDTHTRLIRLHVAGPTSGRKAKKWSAAPPSHRTYIQAPHPRLPRPYRPKTSRRAAEQIAAIAGCRIVRSIDSA